MPPRLLTRIGLLLALAAWRLWGGRAGRLALVIFPTSIGIFAFARAATMDMLLTVSVEAAMVAAVLALPRRPRERSWHRHGFGLRSRLRLALVGAEDQAPEIGVEYRVVGTGSDANFNLLPGNVYLAVLADEPAIRAEQHGRVVNQVPIPLVQA